MKCKYYGYDPVDGEWCKLHRTFFCNFSICKDREDCKDREEVITMSKISVQKAFDTYPPHYQKLAGDGYFDTSLEKREGYVKGYDQAMKDILEKAEEFFYEQFSIHPHDCHVVQYESDNPLEDIDDFVEQFKTYMKDEV